ncbi:glutathione S-transferase [Entophlyctis helioformis]|nr:glutathione S-transferase [Entophlyctis helioformis]
MADAAAGQKLKLYSYWRSSASWRIRIILNHKGIDYETLSVNLLKSEQRGEAFLAVNPAGLLPALQLPSGEIIVESPAIAELLEEMHPEHPLLPTDLVARAKIRAIMSLIACDIHPVQNLRVLQYAGEDRKADWAKHFMTLGFEGLEALLKQTAGKYCFGDELTLADAFLVPQVFNAYRWGVDMTKFPLIAAIDARLAEVDAIKKAHASNQPDAVPPPPSSA